MQRTILFQKNADVINANGKQVGTLERLVLNPETRVVTDIVVRTGSLFNKAARLVPVELVVETTENQIVLSERSDDLESCLPFEERHLVDRSDELDGPSQDMAPVAYGYPELGPALMPASSERFVTRLEQNIPEGMVAMKEGAKVITADGKNVGKVERVLADSSVDQITHLLISTSIFTNEQHLIPMQWVMTVGEDEVHLRVNKDSLEESADPSIAR